MQGNSPVTATAPPDAIDYRLVLGASLLLSLWLIAIDPILNRDAIIYLRTAETYLQDGFIASQSLFDRPLLSVCIALVHQLTGLSLVHSGLALTTLFYALLSVGFVSTLRLMGGDRRVQIIAAIVILSHPMLNDNRSSIFRDQAYWALVILAFRELLLFIRSPGLGHRLKWFACIALATLFRFEGLLFAILAPLTLLFTAPPGRRWIQYLQLMSLPVLVFGSFGVAVLYYQWVINPGDSLFPAIGRYLTEIANFPGEFDRLAQATGDALLVFSARADAGVAVIAGLTAILVINICRALTWPWVAVLAWGALRGLGDRITPRDRVALNIHLLIALLYLAIFTLANRFMLERYSGIFTLLALPYLVFFLNALWTRGPRSTGKVLVITLLLAMSADTLHNGNYKKRFVRDTVTWLQENTPPDACLVSNHLYVTHFSRRQYDWPTAITRNLQLSDFQQRPRLWQGCDYLAIEIKSREESEWQSFLQHFGLEELTSFGYAGRARLAVVKL